MLSNLFMHAKRFTLAFLHSAASATNSASYAFTNVPLGVVSAYRCIVVGVAAYDAEYNRVDTSVTVGSVALTFLNREVVNGTTRCALYYGYVPAGTSATVTVAFSGIMDTCGIGVWSLIGKPVQGVEGIVGLNNPYPDNKFAVCNKGDVVICVIRRLPSGDVTFDAKLTENYDAVTESNVSGHAGGSTVVTATTAPFVVDNYISSEEANTRMCVARFY